MDRSRVAGADAARLGKRTGWAVVEADAGRFVRASFVENLEEVVQRMAMLAVDIPIGLSGDPGVATDETGRRLSDLQAKQVVGPRRSSVFYSPPSACLEFDSYLEARGHTSSLAARAAIAFIGYVTELAEAADHHPDIDIRYSKVTLTLTSHDAGELTERDIALARRIDGLGEREMESKVGF